MITRGAWDGQQGSWPDWGHLDPAAGAAVVLDLLAAEGRLHDEAVRMELAGGDPAGLLAETGRLQAEVARPGIVLVSLVDDRRVPVGELHLEADRVYWR